MRSRFCTTADLGVDTFDEVAVALGDEVIAHGDFDQAIDQVRSLQLDLAGVISALERMRRGGE